MRGFARLSVAAVAVLLVTLGTAAVYAQQDTAPRQRPRTSSLTGGGTLSGDYLAARFAERANDYGVASEYFDQALARDRNNSVLMVQALRMRLAAGRFAAAVQLAPQLSQAASNDVIAPLVLAIDAVGRKDYVAAEKALARLPSDPRMGFLRPYLLAWIKVGQRDFGAAQASLEAGSPNQPDGKPSAIYLLHSGLIDELAGKKDEALRKLRAAYKAPDAATLRIGMTLASFYRRNGKPEEARALMKELYQHSPDLAPLDAMENDKTARLTTVSDGMAEVLFDVFAALASGNGGRVNAGDRNSVGDMAVIFGRLTLQLRPDYDLAKVLLGDLLFQAGHPRMAADTYRTIEKGSVLSWRARLKTAAALDAVGRTDDSIALLTAMVSERTDRVDAAQALGDLYRSKERFADAVKAYDIAVQRLAKPERQDWSLFYARGIVLERTKQWDRAEADFRKALQLEPDQPYVLNYLGYSWIDRGSNLDEGKEMLERAVRQRPNDGAIVDSLAWAHFKLGDYPRAVELLERAVGLNSTDWTINDHLGDAYWRVGRKGEARFQWRRALALKPEPDKIKCIEEKLENGLPDLPGGPKGKNG